MRKVKFKRNVGDDIPESISNNVGADNNNNEETKVAKTGNKRGRPRKNPIALKDENPSQKGKRGRKPKKLYDINPDEQKEIESNGYSDNPVDQDPESSPLRVVERNMKMQDSHTFSFDSLANLTKQNDNYNTNNLPFYPRKQSLNNPFDKF